MDTICYHKFSQLCNHFDNWFITQSSTVWSLVSDHQHGAEFHWELELLYSELLVLPRTASLWSRHTRPAQVGLRLGRTVVAEVWRTAVLSHWHGSPASCCHCVSRLRQTRGNHIVLKCRSMPGLRKTKTPTWIRPFINKNLWPVFVNNCRWQNLQHRLPVLLLFNKQHDLASVNMKRDYRKS